jgi:hypothetical protein
MILAARRQTVLSLVSALEPIVARISELTIKIRRALDAHPDGATCRSLFIAHDSWLCAAGPAHQPLGQGAANHAETTA